MSPIFLDEDPDVLAQRAGARLLAHQLQTMEQQYLDAIAAHAAEVRAIRQQLSEAERIGLRVQKLARKGRKTVRIADLLDFRDLLDDGQAKP